jgi:rhodanese-related sulfurtransferase
MTHSVSAITAADLMQRMGTREAPIIIDVRRREPFDESDRVIAGAVWRPHREAAIWGRTLPTDRDILVYCVHGHEKSESACAELRALGLRAKALAGGFDAFVAAGGATVLKAALPAPWPERPTRWVTRERPKIDRIACPWLIRRFIDPMAAIYYVEPSRVPEIAQELDGIPFDVDGVTFSHRGENCSFDTFLDVLGLEDPALRHVARIVRGADTARLDLEPQCAGLLAISLGISASFADDHRALEAGMLVYDSLYVWTRRARHETHNWPSVSRERAA